MNDTEPPPIEFEESRDIFGIGDFEASSHNTELLGAHNSGATLFKNSHGLETFLMPRITEGPKNVPEDEIWLPHFNVNNSVESPFEIKFDRHKRSEFLEENIHKDSVKFHEGPHKDETRLTHISYPKVCKSKDGLSVDWKEERPSFFPGFEHERFGIEDVRITNMGDMYALTYVCPHRVHGVTTSVATTKDFKEFERIEIMGSPRYIRTTIKDIAYFPKKVQTSLDENDKDALGRKPEYYVLFMRPGAFSDISKAGVWIAFSHNGRASEAEHRVIESEEGEISGTGSPPILFENMWIAAYHEVDYTDIITKDGVDYPAYNTRLMALDAKRPWELKHKSKVILRGRDKTREDDFRPNTVYTMSLIHREDKDVFDFYSGYGDCRTGVDRAKSQNVMDFLRA